MPPIRTTPSKVPKPTGRTHEENQERAYIAASRRSDRSLEARMESARRASEIHKQRTGRALRITEQDVINEEMYEEEDDDLRLQYQRLTAHLQASSLEFRRRLGEYVTSQVAMKTAEQLAHHAQNGQHVQHVHHMQNDPHFQHVQHVQHVQNDQHLHNIQHAQNAQHLQHLQHMQNARHVQQVQNVHIGHPGYPAQYVAPPYDNHPSQMDPSQLMTQQFLAEQQPPFFMPGPVHLPGYQVAPYPAPSDQGEPFPPFPPYDPDLQHASTMPPFPQAQLNTMQAGSPTGDIDGRHSSASLTPADQLSLGQAGATASPSTTMNDRASGQGSQANTKSPERRRQYARRVPVLRDSRRVRRRAGHTDPLDNLIVQSAMQPMSLDQLNQAQAQFQAEANPPMLTNLRHDPVMNGPPLEVLSPSPATHLTPPSVAMTNSIAHDYLQNMALPTLDECQILGDDTWAPFIYHEPCTPEPWGEGEEPLLP